MDGGMPTNKLGGKRCRKGCIRKKDRQKPLKWINFRRAEVVRKISFAAIGGLGVIASYVLLWIGVSLLDLKPWIAYLVQAIIVIECNFFLNRHLTWRDRRDSSSLVRSWLKFHGIRALVTIPLNQALFSILTVVFGWHYVLANTLCIAVATIFNYVTSDKFVFRVNNPCDLQSH